MVDLVRGVDTGESSRKLIDKVEVSFEDDSSGTFTAGNQDIASSQACLAQRIDRDRDLILGADSSRPSTPILYFLHQSKG